MSPEMPNLFDFTQLSSEWMVQTDKLGQTLWQNHTLSEWLHAESAPTDLLGLMELSTEGQGTFTEHWISGPQGPHTSEFRTLKCILEGQHRQIQLRRIANELGWMIWASDQTEWLKQSEAWQHASTHDLTTGLFHRAFFDAEIKRLNRGRHFPISVLVIDIEGLKPINQILGAETGDRLLKAVASCLLEALRADDVVARIGDDEFGILLPNTGSEGAKVVFDRLRAKISETRMIEGDLPWDAALGCATAEALGQLNAAIAEADRRMDAEKLAHRRTRP
jgi:diguanylate cyclase (GGDEF)-like protein